MWNPLAKYMTISHGLELANATAKRAASVDECMNKLIDRLEAVEREVRNLKAAPTLFCSFCAKSQHEVSKLIAGPKAIFICNECVKLCADIILESGAVDKSNNGENSP